MRYVPWTRLEKDQDDHEKVVGVLPQAVALRNDEEYLSATWLEFFSGEKSEQVHSAIKAVRASKIDVRPKSGFSIGVVERITDGCALHAIKIRVLHEEAPDNKAHAAIRHWPRDNDDLLSLMLMASERWSEWLLNRDVPN